MVGGSRSRRVKYDKLQPLVVLLLHEIDFASLNISACMGMANLRYRFVFLVSCFVVHCLLEGED